MRNETNGAVTVFIAAIAAIGTAVFIGWLAYVPANEIELDKSAKLAYYEYNKTRTPTFNGDASTDTHDMINPCARFIKVVQDEYKVESCLFTWDTTTRVLNVKAKTIDKDSHESKNLTRTIENLDVHDLRDLGLYSSIDKRSDSIN